MRKYGLAVGVSAVVQLFNLGVGSASATTLPFYLTLAGPAGGPTVTPPTGSTLYQLWVDPSAIAGTTYGVDADILARGSLTMSGFVDDPANYTVHNLCLGPAPCGVLLPQELRLITGDPINGDSVAFEIGTVTITNSGSGPGDVTLFTGDYVDTTFNLQAASAPQILASVPEPGTLALLGFGMGGLAVLTRRSRG